jgi:hypothetical protein
MNEAPGLIKGLFEIGTAAEFLRFADSANPHLLQEHLEENRRKQTEMIRKCELVW